MKNIILITEDGEQLISSTDDGTNTLYINDNEIPSSNWIGSGNYTTTVNGHAITIKKCTDLNGNCQLIKLSDYNYEMRKTALAGQLQMLNYIYPVGSYYETSDASFDPNVVWGGTWILESGGRVHISAGKMTNNSTNYWGTDNTDLSGNVCDFPIGESGGETKHTLDATQMPSHYHNTQAAFSIRAMSYNGGQPVWGGDGTTVSKLTGSTPDTITQQNAQNTPYNVKFNKNSDSKGGSKAHNNMQPYIVVNRWHRTA
jgi:hypothetical protein